MYPFNHPSHMEKCHAASAKQCLGMDDALVFEHNFVKNDGKHLVFGGMSKKYFGANPHVV